MSSSATSDILSHLVGRIDYPLFLCIIALVRLCTLRGVKPRLLPTLSVDVDAWSRVGRMGQLRPLRECERVEVHCPFIPNLLLLSLIIDLLPRNPISSKYLRPGPILNSLHSLISSHRSISSNSSIGSRIPTLVIDFDDGDQGTRDGCKVLTVFTC